MRDPLLTERAKALRQSSSEPETRLWLALRAKRFAATKFRRQKVIGRYIVDFAARDPMLVVEVDGDTHADQRGYDAERSGHLEQAGYRVIRFTNHEVMTNMDGVLDAIGRAIGTPPLPTNAGSAMPPAWREQRGALLIRHSPEGERAL